MVILACFDNDVLYISPGIKPTPVTNYNLYILFSKFKELFMLQSNKTSCKCFLDFFFDKKDGNTTSLHITTNNRYNIMNTIALSTVLQLSLFN